jgi:DNA-binding SARP family transcriptional activator
LRIEASLGHGSVGRRAARHETRHLVQAVLAIVGSQWTGAERDRLVDLLWPKSGAAAGRNRLYHTVHLARQMLGSVAWDEEWISVRDSRVELDGRIWCDAQELEGASQQDLEGIEDERRQSYAARRRTDRCQQRLNVVARHIGACEFGL